MLHFCLESQIYATGDALLQLARPVVEKEDKAQCSSVVENVLWSLRFKPQVQIMAASPGRARNRCSRMPVNLLSVTVANSDLTMV